MNRASASAELHAGVAELADAYGSGPYECKFMQVQVLLPAPGLDVTFDTKWREKNSRFFGGFSLCLHQFF